MANRPAPPTRDPVLVIGLGRFGSSLACTLVDLGNEVLGVDTDPRLVQSHSTTLTHVVEADATDAEALRQIGAPQFSRAVVAIGTGIEASVLATAALVDLGVPEVWAKAINYEHRRILERVGAHRIVLPETEAGRRVAHLIGGSLFEFIDLGDGFVLAELDAPADLIGRTLGDANLRATHRVTAVCVKHRNGPFTYAGVDTVIEPGDRVVLAGMDDDVERYVGRRQ